MLSNAHKPRVLLVDEEPLLLEMFEGVLTNKGYEVTTSSNARDTINLLKLSEFEILISDVLLSDLDGFEISLFTKKLYPNTTTILTTGAPNPIDAQRAKINNILYLTKPVGFEQLIKVIESELANTYYKDIKLKAA